MQRLQLKVLRPLASLLQLNGQQQSGISAFSNPSIFRLFSSGDDENKGRHPYFPAISTNPVQPKLEAAEAEKAWDSLFTSPWFELYEDPVTSVLNTAAQPLVKVRAAVLGPLYNRMSEIATQIIQNEVEGDFDKDEFLEGSGLAVQGLYDMVTAKDWSGLSNIASEKVVDRLRIALFELEAAHQVELSSIHVKSLDSVRMGPATLWTGKNVARFDEQWAEKVGPNTADSFLVATAAVQATLEAKYKDTQSGKELPPRLLIRQGAWLFGRGPLPRGFSSQLHGLPWKVLALW